MVKTAVMIIVKNCKRGTAAYYHEQRHKEQEERWGLISLSGSLQHYLLLAAFVGAWLQRWGVVSLLLLGLLLNDFVLEWDAELYSLRRVGLRRWLLRSWL